jgi:putative flippase GtrA
MTSTLTKAIMFFYPIFSKFMDKRTFLYAACGGGNLVLSWILFFMFYQFLFTKDNLEFSQFTLSAYTASAMLCFIISFSIGFLLMKFVVFTESELKGRIQFFRYGVSSLVSSIVSWSLLKFFIDILGIFPSISNVIASCLVVIVSYILQKKYTFK